MGHGYVMTSVPMDDPGLVAYLAELNATSGPSALELGVDALRERMAERTASRPEGPAIDHVRDVVVKADPRVLVRIYRPSPGPLPLLIFFHGGGWTLGNLDSHDRTCRRIADAGEVAVLAVDYRLAPEHRWPAAVDDGLAVVRWVRSAPGELGEITRVGVGGDSAGANIATLLSIQLRDAGEPVPDLQVLINPHLDLTGSSDSMVESATGWGLTADDAHWFAEQWVAKPELRGHPRVSPVFEPDLSGLPPAIVVTMEHDPLRDEGDRYARRLAEAGVEVIHRREPHMVHGYLSMDTVSTRAKRAHDVLFADIARMLAPRS